MFTSVQSLSRRIYFAIANFVVVLFWLGPLGSAVSWAQETTCARVKIEIKQELTLERQAFDAEMKISNQLDGASLTNVSVVVKVTDELGTPVLISDDPNNLGAKLFVRVSSKDGIAAVDGTGAVAASSTATINWLIIPAPGSAGTSPFGKKYLVGATLKYKFGAEEQTLDVSPDVITVKPLPLLTLDYFLQQDVVADDPLTPEVEAVEPFTLGVRVKNTGFAVAKNLKIDSAQPKIIENNQGLLIGFKLTGSYVNDAPAQNTLLINFGEIAPASSKMGRWNMETTLAGKFTEFTARFTHADELGGSLTSLLQATNAHFLIRDVLVDLPGRDLVRDFLAQDSDGVRVYESDSTDTQVTDRSAVATLTGGTNAAGNPSYRLVMPATAGFVYVRLPDPFNGTRVLGQIGRSDAKRMLPENVWLSKTRNLVAKRWEYWINVFDVNSPGVYETEFKLPSAAGQPPVLQFIADRTVREEQQASFIVEASSPAGLPVTLTAAPLPAGARFTPQASDPQAPTLARAVFDWTPPKGTAGTYLVTYTASDGTLNATRSATLRVESNAPPPGPGTPGIDAPASGAQVPALRPTFSVLTSSNPQDPTTRVQFELYRDEAMTQLVESATVDKAAPGVGGVVQPTSWRVAADLNDNTPYWWRARAYDGSQLYSAWVNARLTVNLFNDPPDSFNLASPVPGGEVATLQPELSWANSVDKDGDAITYSVRVYRDAALTDLAQSAIDLTPGDGGSTRWAVAAPLVNHVRYFWQVSAKDAHGALTTTAARPFVVNTGNTAPTAPVILSPAVGGQSASASTALTVQNSSDAEADLITYVFELDTVNTFDSGDKRSSGPVVQSAASSTAWTVSDLVENRRYHWRVKAQDGRAESAWTAGDFVLNAVNDAPPVPTVRNPGDGSWSPTTQPSLELNPVVDPEGEAVRYEFEVYRDAALTQRVASGVSANTGWIVPVALADQSTHWWRARALDAQDKPSEWAQAVVLYVSTGPYSPPTIQVTAPAFTQAPVVAGERKTVTIRWEGLDPNIEPNVALYHASSNSGGFVGTQIVDGLRQAAGRQTGSYEWDVSGLAPGVYYVWAAIYDARGMGRAWAPGAVVVPASPQSGRLVVTPPGPLATTEDGGVARFTVRLANPPSAPVVVPVSTSSGREGVASPNSLSFTPLNWNVSQLVTVTGRTDCIRDGSQQYQAVVGKAITLDPQYIDAAASVRLISADSNISPNIAGNNLNFGVCSLTVVSQSKPDAVTWEYVVAGSVGNTGPGVNGVTATLLSAPFGIQMVQPNLVFGAVAQGDSGRSTNTLVLRSRTPLSPTLFLTGTGFRWSVTVR